MRQILIIADDLSGAADCGIACASFGLSATVVLRHGAAELEEDVVSVDADTRCLTPEMAAAETFKLMQQYGRNERLVFKKLDSTLRGNVGAELAAVLHAQRSFNPQHGHVVAVMAPAFPAHGRTTSQGRQLLNGRPLEEMEIWKRERRTGRSHIPEILQAAGMRATLLGLDLVRSNNGALGRAMTEFAESCDVLVCDAETDGDLRAIADAGIFLGRGTVWAGSAGLAYHLPEAAGFVSDRPSISQSVSLQPLASGPTLFVVGSVSNVSREQVKVLTSNSDAMMIAIPPSDLLAEPKSPKWPGFESAILQALENGHDVVTLLGAEGPDAGDNGQREVGLSKGRVLTSALAKLVAPCAEPVGALVATGGETARSVLQAWGVSGLRLVGELETGVPFSVTANWSRHLPVLTKAGDFGNPQTLLHCQRFLRGLDRASAATIYHGKEL
jgi:uncharacterized protein YgbK (DUF1537 family)